MCRFACPVAQTEARESVTPTAKMTMLYLIGKGFIKPSPELIDPLYKCTNCLHCFTYCAHKNMILPVYYSAREELRKFAREEIYQKAEKYKTNYLSSGNPFGASIYNKLNEILPGTGGSKKGVVFFPGCTESKFFPESLSHVYNLIRKIVSGSVAYKELNNCCGYPLMNAGLMDEFRDNAVKVAQNFNDANLIISNCPACVYVLGGIYSGLDIVIKPPVITAVEFFVKNLNGLMLRTEDNKKNAIYHDPCYLGRYRKIYEEPRLLISAMGIEVSEFSWSRVDSECCGASVSHLFPDLSHNIGKKRLDSVPPGSGGALFTSCPACRMQFSRISSKMVFDVAEEIAKRVL